MRGVRMGEASLAEHTFARRLADMVLSGGVAGRDELMALVDEPLAHLAKAADEIRARCCGDEFDLCTIMSVKSGRCGEDCKFCAQSARWQTTVSCSPFDTVENVAACAREAFGAGAHRFSMVSSGGRIAAGELEIACNSAREIRATQCGGVCASFGLLNRKGFEKLREAGVTRIHNNLETSRSFFPKICTTHTYDEKLQSISDARAAGLEVCSGGIVGMGETWNDRIDLALELRSLGVVSVPINVLNPLPGTPLEKLPPLSIDEVCRVFAIFRFALPCVSLRLAGGRALLPDAGRACLSSGANAAISGDMLTTKGFAIQDDKRMFEEEGFVSYW